CATSAGVVLLTLFPVPRLRPKSRGMQHAFLQDLTKGFPIRRFSPSIRIGGAGGGMVGGFLLCALIPFGLDALFLAPMQDGRFFAVAEAACNNAAISGATNLAVESTNANAHLSDNCLDQAIWRLAWKSSIAAMVIPIGLLIALNYAI